MKKLLLSFAAMLMAATSVVAEDVVDDFSTAAWLPTAENAEGEEVTSTSTDIKYTMVNCKKGTYQGVSYLQLSGKSKTPKGSISFSLPYNCSKIIVHTGSSASTNVTVQFSANDVAVGSAVKLATKDADFTFDIPEASQAAGTVYKFAVTNNYNAQFSSMTYTPETGVASSVAKPQMAMGENNTVVITAEEGAEIRYTIDGSQPSAASTLYTAPIAITAKTTVKAVAVKGSDVSSVASFDAVPNVVGGIAAFIANANAADTKIDAAVTVLYQNGRNLYLKDAKDGYILAYNGNNVEGIAGAYKNGDILASVTGAYKSQNGLPELILSVVGAKTEGAAVQPAEYALDELSMSMLNEYVKVSGLTIEAASKANNYTATDADGNKIAIYNTFYNASYYDVVEVKEGTDMTVTGFVSCYNSTLQLTPVLVEGKAMEHVAAPVFTPEAGAVKAGTVVTIASATEGASIYYTLDGTEPTKASTPYAGGITINEAATVKAIAVKEGMLDSDVATAVYTIAIEGSMTATFNFSEPASLNPVQVAPEAGKATNLTGVTLTDKAISITFDKGTNQNEPRLWNPTGTYTGQIDFRVYGDNTLAFAGNGAKILSITFNPRNTTSKWGKFNTETEGEWTANGQVNVFTLAASANAVTLTAAATSNIGSIDVVYIADTTTGVADIEAEDADAPVEYYNIQGMRVNADSLTPGLYIRRQVRTATKIYVK